MFEKFDKPKDPDEVLDFGVDWTKRLAGDVINSSQWIITPAGLTADDHNFSSPIATVWLSGGTLGANYNLTNRITTVGGRTMDHTRTLKVREK